MKNKGKDSNTGNFGKWGWALIIYSLMVQLLQTMTSNSIGNMAAREFSAMYGWDLTTLLSVGSIFGWISVIAIIICGGFLRKGSPKKVATISGIIYVLAVFAFPHVKHFWQYCAAYFFLYMCSPIRNQQANSIITANWFPRKKGIVMGWTTIGISLGGGIGVVCYNLLSKKVGMTGVYYIYGGLMALTVLFCAFCLTDYPEEKGLFPDNDESMTREEANRMLEEGRRIAENSVWTTKNLLTCKEVWLLALSCGIQMMFAGGFMGQMIPRLLAGGFEMGTATMIMMMAAIISCFGSVYAGVIDSKFGPKIAVILTHVCAIIGCVLNLVPNNICVIIGLAFVGIVMGGASNFLVSTISSYWGRYHFSKALAVILPINQLVGSCGSIVIAQVAARYSYNGSYIVMGILALIGIGLFALIKPENITKREKELEAQRDAAKAAQ